MLKASSDVTIRTEVNLNSNIAGALPLPTDINSTEPTCRFYL